MGSRRRADSVDLPHLEHDKATVLGIADVDFPLCRVCGVRRTFDVAGVGPFVGEAGAVGLALADGFLDRLVVDRDFEPVCSHVLSVPAPPQAAAGSLETDSLKMLTTRYG